MEKKKIFFVAIMATIFALSASFGASAREVRVNKDINAETASSYETYLRENPSDTIYYIVSENETCVVKRLGFIGSDGRPKVQLVTEEKRIKTEPASELLASTSRKFQESLALEAAYTNPYRDIVYAHSEEVESYACENGVSHENAGKGVIEAMTRQGLALRGGAGMSLLNGKISPEFFLGGSYSFRELLKFYLAGVIGQTEFGSLSYAGSRYWTYGYEARAAVKLLQLNTRSSHNRFYVSAGVRQLWQKVGEEWVIINEESGQRGRIDSWGNNIALVGGLSYEWTPFCRPYGLEVSLLYSHNFWGEFDSSRNKGSLIFNVAFEWALLRDVVGLK